MCIRDSNTPATINAIGVATSDIAEMACCYETSEYLMGIPLGVYGSSMAKITAIDEEKQKISLSIRALLAPAADEEDAPVEE